MVWTTLPPTSVDKDSIIDEALMDAGIKNNDDDHETRILALEAGGGGGGGGADSGAFAQILGGLQTNDGVFWRKRFSPNQSNLRPLERADFEGVDHEERFVYDETNDHLLTVQTSVNTYLGSYLTVADNGKFTFKIKKGENFFGLGLLTGVNSDSITVLVDGQSLTTAGIVDETGAARANTFSANTTTQFFGRTEWFFGLDGEEHLISVENTATNTLFFELEFVEVGFRTLNPTISEKVKISSGRASVQGTEVSISPQELTFTKASGYGKTSAIVSDTSGTLSVVEGEEPAQTQLRAEVAHAFSGGVTSLECKNTYYFPSTGIGFMSLPNGGKHIFSWTSKDEATIQAHSLDGVIWKSEPKEDFTPLDGFGGASGEATGDANINYLATAPIIISASNNKIDFQITVNGAQTSHTATIANGAYSGDDLLPLGAAINTAMQAVKPINGRYFATWGEDSKRWVVGVESHEVTEIQYLVNTGASGSANVLLSLGYANSDITGALSYQATTETTHKAARVLEFDSNFMDALHPRIKYNWAGDIALDDEIQDVQDRLNIGPLRSISATTNIVTVYPDHDCVGIQVTFLTKNSATMIAVQADNHQMVYLLNPSSHANVGTEPPRARLISGFITFPRGSKIIKIFPKIEDEFSIHTGTNLYFVGARQIYTRAPIDKLAGDESIIKAFDIAPLQLYETPYGHNGAVLYSPTATDNVDTITETGTWNANASDASSWNFNGRFTNTSGDYVEIDFTLAGNGGGIRIISDGIGGYSSKTALFLNTQAAGITEANDRIQNENHDFGAGASLREISMHEILGLPAGSYTARWKNEVNTETMQYSGFAIIDTVQPDRNKNTVSDVTGTGQGVTYPINTIKNSIERDANVLVADQLFRSGYKEGITKNIDSATGLLSGNWTNLDETNSLIEEHELFGGARLIMGQTVNQYVRFFGFANSVCVKMAERQDFTTTITPAMEGINAANTFSTRVAVKGGSSGLAAQLAYGYLFSKFYDLDCSFSAGDTFTIADTRGLRVDQEILLYDGTNFESASILSIVTNVSFTVKKARSVVVDANVTDVYFYGFHALKLDIDNANIAVFGSIEHEPLTISPSRALERIQRNVEYETVSASFSNVANGNDLTFPVHSDGVAGDWRTSSVSVTAKSAASTFTIPRDLKSIVVSAGTIDVKVTSTRKISTETGNFA